MKKISKLLEYFGLVNGEDKQETDETMENQQQDEGKVVPMFGSGSAGTWRDKSSDREYDKYDRPYEKTYEKPYDKVFDKDYDGTADSSREETSSSRTGDKVISRFLNGVKKRIVSQQCIIHLPCLWKRTFHFWIQILEKFVQKHMISY